MLALCLAVSRVATSAVPQRRAFANVAGRYVASRKHPQLFAPSRVSEWLDPQFLDLQSALADADVMETNKDSIVRSFVVEEARQIYSFPLLSGQACDWLCEEVINFQETGLPARRPNSMNNYGIILNEIGLKEALSVLQGLVQPVAQALFPLEATKFDAHHSFVVSYRPDEDRGLDMHTDDSDVTLNVCLGRDFEAAGLTFCGDMGTPDHRLTSFRYQHVRGRALLHLGRRRHGADDIARGHRMNLIMWNHNHNYRASAAYRSRPYFKEEGKPDALCVSFTHDRDYEAVVGEERPEGHERFANSAWCPPPQAEYAGFYGKKGRYRDLLDSDDIDAVLGPRQT